MISPTHLKKHNITMQEYKKMYPDSKIVSDEVSKKLADNARNNENIGFKKGVKHKNHTTWNKGLKKMDHKSIENYSKKLKKPKSEEHKMNISKSKLKNTKYTNCQICNNIKSKTNRKLCVSCAQKIRAKNYVNGMKGRKLSEEHKIKLLQSTKTSFTKPEMKVLDSYSGLGLIYTGDRKKWIRFKDGSFKNPDFIFGNFQICVEVFGDYWHKNEDPNILVNKYEEVDWRCLVLWEKEIKKHSIYSLSERINQFINFDNYIYSDRESDDYADRFIV
jgi:G:T-mismatch repair DNA endonuclease (very short patch repair protein)